MIPPLTDAPTWLIDPIDGTTNFVHTFPFTCVSIAFAVGGQVVLGVVYNPILEELFVAARGHGAFLNSKPIRCSSCTQLSQAIVVRALPGYGLFDLLRALLLLLSRRMRDLVRLS